jgi:DNA-binding winged helix-turn-helix (wHTH) protein
VSYRCGDFHLDPANRKFTWRGTEIPLEPKTLAVLVQLVLRAGTLITRNEILDAVWGHRHVTPSALNRRIALARRAFSDDADEPKYIQTVHGAGYRYIGPLERQDPILSGQNLRFAAPERSAHRANFVSGDRARARRAAAANPAVPEGSSAGHRRGSGSVTGGSCNRSGRCIRWRMRSVVRSR